MKMDAVYVWVEVWSPNSFCHLILCQTPVKQFSQAINFEGESQTYVVQYSLLKQGFETLIGKECFPNLKQVVSWMTFSIYSRRRPDEISFCCNFLSRAFEASDEQISSVSLNTVLNIYADSYLKSQSGRLNTTFQIQSSINDTVILISLRINLNTMPFQSHVFSEDS